MLFVGPAALVSARYGLNRLVGRLAWQLPAYCPTEFVKWDPQYGGLRYLDRHELELLFEDRTLPPSVRVHPLAHRVGGRFAAALDKTAHNWLLVPGMPPEVRFCLEPEGMRIASIIDSSLATQAAGEQAFAGCDLIIAPSRHAADRVGTPERVVVVPFPNDDSASPATTREREIGKRDAVVLFSGLEPQEWQFEVVRAFCRLQDRELSGLELVIVGAISNTWLASLNELLAAGARVRYVGHWRREYVESCLGRVRFAVAAADGSLGEPLLTALSHGIPCLTSKTGAREELAAGGGCLGIDLASADEISKGLVRLAVDPDLCARLKREVAERSRRSWSDYCAELVGQLASSRQPL